MPASDDVVVRLVIQDSGQSPAAQRPQTGQQASPQDNQGSLPGSSSVFTADPNYYVSQPRPGPSVEQVLAQPATRRAQDASAAKAEQVKAPTNELIDLAAQYAGINQKHVQAVRDYFAPKPAEPIPEVTKAPDVVKTNEPKAPLPDLKQVKPVEPMNIAEKGLNLNINQPGIPFQQQPPKITAGATGPPIVPPVGPGGAAAGPAPAAPVPGGAGMSALAAGALAAGIGAAIRLVENKIGEMGETARKRIGSGEEISKNVVQNDAAGAAASGLNMAADVAEIIPIGGKILGEMYRTEAKFIQAIDNMAKVVMDRSRELSRYSVELAASSARQDVRTLMADIKESRQLGGSYARVSDSYGELTMMLREMLLPIKQFLLDTLANVLNDIKAILEVVVPVVRTIVDTLQFVSNVANWFQENVVNLVVPQWGIFIDILKLLKKWLVKQDKEELPDTLVQFFGLLDQANMPNFNNKRPEGFGKPGLNIPAFGGL